MKPKGLVEQHMGSCIHFTGLWENKTCKAGVDYETVKGAPTDRFAFSLPCLGDPGATCAHQQFPTREEAEEYERRAMEGLAHTVAARVRIREQTKGKRGVAGTIECPKCKGKLRYTVSGYNGHVWGTCETPGCLRWIE